MIRASVVTLVAATPDAHGVYDSPATSTREVPCDVQSVGRREFYEAKTHGLSPEWVLVLSDYAEYQDELICIFEGKPYKIVRTYTRNDNRIELTVERVTNYDL